MHTSAKHSRRKDKEKGQKPLLSPRHPIKVNLWSFHFSPRVRCMPHLVNTHFNDRESVRQ